MSDSANGLLRFGILLKNRVITSNPGRSGTQVALPGQFAGDRVELPICVSVSLTRGAFSTDNFWLPRSKTLRGPSYSSNSTPGTPCPACGAAYGAPRPADHPPSGTTHPACHAACGPPGSPRRASRCASSTTPRSSCLPICSGHVFPPQRNCAHAPVSIAYGHRELKRAQFLRIVTLQLV